MEALLIALDLEVVPEAADPDIVRWRDAGLNTDAPVIAAALSAAVDYFCSEDTRLIRAVRGLSLSCGIMTPAELSRTLQS